MADTAAAGKVVVVVGQEIRVAANKEMLLAGARIVERAAKVVVPVAAPVAAVVVVGGLSS